jgi:hypothetical protein
MAFTINTGCRFAVPPFMGAGISVSFPMNSSYEVQISASRASTGDCQ